MIIVDTNILVDIAGPETEWRAKSLDALSRAATSASLIANAVIFAEFSFGFDTAESCDEALRAMGLRLDEIPLEGLFRAGRAFKLYRQRGGAKTSPLPDFFIGGHASAIGAPILTRDAARYNSYFPDVQLLSS